MEKINRTIHQAVQRNVKLNGVDLKLVTHLQDKTHGAMFRGEIPICKSFLAQLEILQNAIKPNYKVIDAGANIGSVAIVLAKTQPDAFIYCFEPDVLNALLLNINIMLNEVDNIIVFNYALGKKREYINMYLSKTNFGDHRSVLCTKNDLNENNFDISASKVLKVNPNQFFKEYLDSISARVFDLVKIDTQGSDFEILEACVPLLKKNSLVTLEYSPYHLDANKTAKKDITNTLNYFTNIQKINPFNSLPRLSDIDIPSILKFYDEQYKHYRTEWDIVLRKK